MTDVARAMLVVTCVACGVDQPCELPSLHSCPWCSGRAFRWDDSAWARAGAAEMRLRGKAAA